MNRGASVNLSGLSLRDLEYVAAVADHGSFVKAAAQCHVAQPSLSAQVSKLEARLKTTIFERTTRRLIITRKGQQLVNQMRRVLVEARAILALAGESQQPFGGVLRLFAISISVLMSSRACSVISVAVTLDYR
jgi:LysR family transcriptional regulator, hydrogen peroxide-inducible genes activator